MAKAPISRIDNAYARSQDMKFQQNKWTQHKRQVHRRRGIFMLAVLVIVLFTGGTQLVRLQHEQQAAAAQLAVSKSKLKQVKTRKSALKVQVDQLNNPGYLEKMIRSQYYVSKKGETVFTLPASANKVPGEDTESNK